MDNANPIATARRAKGMTQEQLATAVGVSRGAVAQWEMDDGTRPDPVNALAVCKALGISLEAIYACGQAA